MNSWKEILVEKITFGLFICTSLGIITDHCQEIRSEFLNLTLQWVWECSGTLCLFSEVKPVHKEEVRYIGHGFRDPILLVSVRYMLFTLLSPGVFKPPALMRYVEELWDAQTHHSVQDVHYPDFGTIQSVKMASFHHRTATTSNSSTWWGAWNSPQLNSALDASKSDPGYVSWSLHPSLWKDLAAVDRSHLPPPGSSAGSARWWLRRKDRHQVWSVIISSLPEWSSM